MDLYNVVYHVWIEGEVKIEPTIPADWQIRIARISLVILIFMLIIIGFYIFNWIVGGCFTFISLSSFRLCFN